VGGQVLRVAWYRFPAIFGRRRNGYLAIVLLIGLTGGVAMGSFAAARFNRKLERNHAAVA